MKKYLVKIDPVGWESGDKGCNWYIMEGDDFSLSVPVNHNEIHLIPTSGAPEQITHFGGRRISKYLIK